MNTVPLSPKIRDYMAQRSPTNSPTPPIVLPCSEKYVYMPSLRTTPEEIELMNNLREYVSKTQSESVPKPEDNQT